MSILHFQVMFLIGFCQMILPMKTQLSILAIGLCFIACQKNYESQKTTDGDAIAGVSKASLKQSSSLQLVYQDSLYQLTGVAVSHTGRLFTNYPLWKGPHKYDVVEVNGINEATPYPNAEWNSWQPGEDGSNKWVCVQAVYVDDADNLWVVDPASPHQQGVYRQDYKLVKINLQTNAVEKIYLFTFTADKGSYINDVRVDTASQFAYLTNSSEGGIVVVNLATGQMRQVLGGDPSVISDPAYHLTFGGKELKYDFGQPVKFNSDGLALTPDAKWLYYKPLSDDRLFRIETKYLQDFSLSPTRLASHVDFVGRYTVTDGMIFDKKGNLYFGDMQHFRIIRITPDGAVQEVVTDPRLIWPDSYSISSDGYLYVSCSQIMLQPEYNFTNILPPTPYTIYKINIGN